MAAVRVQSKKNDNASGTGTLNLNPGSATTAGSLCVVLASQYGGTPAAPTVADSASQAWTQALSAVARTSLRMSILYKVNSASITTCTLTPANIASSIFLEYSGVATAPTVVVGTIKDSGSSVTSWSSNAITTAASSLMLGFAATIFTGTGSFAATGAWGVGVDFNNATDGDDSWFEEQLNASSGAGLTATGTCASNIIDAVAIAFTLAAGGGVVEERRLATLGAGS